jgi:DNA-binding winged helix-turn-helix (wHTH) protein
MTATVGGSDMTADAAGVRGAGEGSCPCADAAANDATAASAKRVGLNGSTMAPPFTLTASIVPPAGAQVLKESLKRSEIRAVGRHYNHGLDPTPGRGARVRRRMTYRFGPFQLDARSRQLTRDGERMNLPDRYVDILLQLVSRAGQVIAKDALIEAAWKDVAVTDNSLEQAISSLRRTLGPAPGGVPYIETLARRGYRFRVEVRAATSRRSDEELGALLAPHRAFVQGRTALESLDRAEVARACGVFEEIARMAPDYAPAHLGLANALSLQFESLRSGASRDDALLVRALHHASEACRLDPSSGEAWATLSLICHQSHDHERAIAAARRASSLEPDNWRHYLRMAYVSWGEQRLRAAHSVLRLLPDFPFARWLAATVHIARQAFADAERELVAGVAAQERQPPGAAFKGVGLHLFLGLVRLATGDERSALAEIERELALGASGHIYAREACANAWCAIGAIRLAQGHRDSALDAFDRALEAVEGHAAAVAARAAASRPAQLADARSALDRRLQDLRDHGAPVEAAVSEAIHAALTGDSEGAARLVLAALERAPAGSNGWTVPVDPLLRVTAHLRAWEPVLVLLRGRAA